MSESSVSYPYNAPNLRKDETVVCGTPDSALNAVDAIWEAETLFNLPSISKPDALCDALFLSWLAGFVDGEGCFHVRKYQDKRVKQPYYIPVIMIAQCDREPLDYIQERLGRGGVYEMPRRGERWRKAHALHFNGAQAIEIAATLLQYLRIKQEQARLFSVFPMTGSRNQHSSVDVTIKATQEGIYSAIRHLNRRGTRDD